MSLVAADGRVAASAQATEPGQVSCGNAAAAALPLPVSTSNSRAYFLDAQGNVAFLTPSGETGRATHVPSGGAIRSMFAVSPDDQRIAVVENTYNASGATTVLYVEDLNGGTNHINLFSETGAYTLWPIGWHGGDGSLVVAKVAACTQGGGPLCCGPLELHVIDPATGVRRFTLGGPDCVIAGPPTPAGAICETTAVDGFQVDWTSATHSLGVVGARQLVYLSPDGVHLARSNGTSTFITTGVIIGALNNTTTLSMVACGWVDNTHVIAGGDTQAQPRIGDIASGNIAPVAAQGVCGGRIPGGL